jgi:hypothetical protein
MKKYFSISLIAVFVLVGLFVVSSAMAGAVPVQGPYNGSTFVDNNSVGTLTWSSPSNAQTSNNVYAVATSPGAGPQVTHYLKATNFGFSIPAGATIDGIVVMVERKTDSTSVKDSGVYLVKNGTISGTNHSVTTSGTGFTSCLSPVTGTNCWSTTEATVSYGSPTDLWGTEWTVSDINNIASGIVFSASRTYGTGSRTISMDSITMMVYYTLDTTPPTLYLPSNITAEATSSAGAVVTFSATATDANPANPIVTCTPPSGSTFPLSTTTVNCSATDAVGNTANGSFTVTIQDTTAPVITVPSDVTVEAGEGGETIVNYTASAADIVDGETIVSCSPISGSTFSLGTTTVSCSSTDAHSNEGTANFDVIVSDTEGPVLVLPSPVVEATSASGAIVEYTATASDLVDGPVSVECAPASGSVFPLGPTTVNCSASDSADPVNTSSGSFVVVVQDTTDPIVTLNTPIQGYILKPNVSFSFVYTDNVDASIDCTLYLNGQLAENHQASNGVEATWVYEVVNTGNNSSYVSCTDAAGNTGISNENSFSVIHGRRPQAGDTLTFTPPTGGTETTPPPVEEVVVPETTTPPEGQVLGAEVFVFLNDMAFGSRLSPDVTELQNRLKTEGFFSITSTGYFGPLTKAAVKKYQAANPPLAIDGIVGPLTRAVLNK